MNLFHILKMNYCTNEFSALFLLHLLASNLFYVYIFKLIVLVSSLKIAAAVKNPSFPAWTVCPASWSASAQTQLWPPQETAWSPGALDRLMTAPVSPPHLLIPAASMSQSEPDGAKDSISIKTDRLPPSTRRTLKYSR